MAFLVALQQRRGVLFGKKLKKQNKMYYKNKIPKTSIKRNTSYEGETIEQKINRIVNNKEPIKDGAPIIYTDRKDGVKPEYDIRTDRFEIAIDAMDAVAKSHKAKREHSLGERAKANMAKEKETEVTKDGGPESTGPKSGTDPK